MKISIVIPAYNEEKYIENCLKSLKNQEEKADEIIVVDNRSTDKTSQICKKYTVKIIFEEKKGMAHARNKGFNSAKYEILARCDADTILPKDWIKRIKENFKKYKIDALTGPCFFHDFPLKYKNLSDNNIVLDLIKMLLNGRETMNGPNMALTKKIWDKVKKNVCTDDSKVHEDMDLALNIIRVGGKIKRDRNLIIATSARRILNKPLSVFGEYTIRGIKTYLRYYIKNHEEDLFMQKAKNFLHQLQKYKEDIDGK